jgi:hypothetical protein
MTLFSPAAAKRALSDAIDMLDGRKLMFGTTARTWKKCTVQSSIHIEYSPRFWLRQSGVGFLTEGAAMQIARRVLYSNAMELYNLKVPSDHAVEPVAGGYSKAQ